MSSMIYNANLALWTARVMLLGVGSLGAVEGLVGDEVVHRGELDAAGGADQLDERRRRRARGRRTRHAALPGLAVVLLVGDEVLVPAEHDVALLASAPDKSPKLLH